MNETRPNETPRVSIGLPVYNGANFIKAAIRSILNQSFQDFELIISDNGSSDQTPEICTAFADQDNRIQYVRQPENRGAIWNFNETFRMSRGKYFKWASHDDVLEPSFLKKCVDVMESDDSIAWCHCDSDMIDSLGRSWLSRLPESDEEIEVSPAGTRRWKGLPRDDFDHVAPHRRYAGILLGTRWCVDSYGLIRSNALRKTRLLVNLYGAEKVLMGELGLQGKTYQIPEMLFSQRIHPNASSYQNDGDAQQQFVAARDAKPFTSTRLSLLLAHFGGIRHSPLPWHQKMNCLWVLARYTFQIKKWVRLLKQRGRFGGGGKRIIEAAVGQDSTSGAQSP